MAFPRFPRATAAEAASCMGQQGHAPLAMRTIKVGEQLWLVTTA